jgi:hypothetical protein
VAGEVSFGAADGFSFGFAFGRFAVEVDPGLGIGSRSAKGDDVDRAVELAVAAAVQSVSAGVPELAGIGAVSVCRANAASLLKR